MSWFIKVSALLLKAGRCVSALVPLVGKEDEGISAGGCISLGNTVLLFSPRSGHFLTVKESWKDTRFKKRSRNLSWQVSTSPKAIKYWSCYTVSVKLSHILCSDKTHLTFDDLQAFLLRYKHGISSSSFRSESLLPLDLHKSTKNPDVITTQEFAQETQGFL